MSAEDNNPPPDTTQGQPAEAQGKGTAYDEVRATDNGADAEHHVSIGKQEPTEEVNGSADGGRHHEEDVEARSYQRQIWQNPDFMLNATLAYAPVALVIATIVLAGATIALWRATDRLGDITGQLVAATNSVAKATQALNNTTGKLVDATDTVANATNSVGDRTANLVSSTDKLATATDRLRAATESMAKDAKEQSADMKESLTIARTASDAAVSASNSSAKMVQALLKGNAISQQIQKASISIGDIDVGNLAEWGASSSNARVEVKNTGPVEARNVRIAAQMIVARPTYSPCRATHLKLEPTASIGPNGGSATIDAPARHAISSDQVANVRAGKSAIFVWGRMTFSDPSNRFRSKDFCMSFSGQIPENGPLPFAITEHCNGGN